MPLSFHSTLRLPCEACFLRFHRRLSCSRLLATRLVIGRRDDPRVLVVELHRPDVVEVAQQSEQATPELVVPDLFVCRAGARVWGVSRGDDVEGTAVRLLFTDDSKLDVNTRHTTGRQKRVRGGGVYSSSSALGSNGRGVTRSNARQR